MKCPHRVGLVPALVNSKFRSKPNYNTASSQGTLLIPRAWPDPFILLVFLIDLFDGNKSRKGQYTATLEMRRRRTHSTETQNRMLPSGDLRQLKRAWLPFQPTNPSGPRACVRQYVSQDSSLTRASVEHGLSVHHQNKCKRDHRDRSNKWTCMKKDQITFLD
jgi:hypothetical protein